MRHRPRRIGTVLVASIVFVGAGCTEGSDSSSAEPTPETTSSEASPERGSSAPASTTTSAPPVTPPGEDACIPAEERAPVAAEGESVVVLGCVGPDGFVVPSLRATDAGAATTTEDRIATVAEGLSDEELELGFIVAWPEPIGVSVEREGDAVLIDVASEVQELVISSPTESNAFFVPLVGTAFLDPSVTVVTVTLDGDEAAAAEWWQATDTTWDRTEWQGG